jgi:predicted metalloprotease with PDZ domain
MTARVGWFVLLSGALGLTAPLGAQARRGTPAPGPVRSAPVANLRYQVIFDSATAKDRLMKVVVTFDVTGPGAVLLSLPAWTPGSYEVSNFARWVENFQATGGSRPLVWDKLDYDTWRLQPAGARAITVSFDFLADTLDNAIAWSRPDFLLFNGTNVFPYPEGLGYDFPATVTVRTQTGWLVASGMKSSGPGSYSAANYHDLVDMPFFVGRFDYDSSQVAGVWTRLASYPAGTLTGLARARFWDDVRRVIPAEAAVFQETPWANYTIMDIFTPTYGGGSALEHQSSHVGIYNSAFIGNPILASISAHEIFHAWNVKRMRPAEMVPYDYSHAQPTPWLWVSEGITDYYADLALVRSGIVDSAGFLGVTNEKIGAVAEAPVTALEDASLSTWIHPEDGSAYIYYQKGSLAGFMLDIMIRDASDNRRSLDDVMREVYRTTYKRGRGFSAADWWGAVSRAAGGRSFADFNARYVDGREPYPWGQVLPLAGLRMVQDTVREPRLGISTSQDSTGAIVLQAVQPGSAGDEAGLKPGDQLLALGDIAITSDDFGPAYRARFGKSEGDSLPIRIRRGSDTLTLQGKVRLVSRVETRLEADSSAGDKAVRIRRGLLRGTTDH